MEYKQRREPIAVNEVICDRCQEQPVDLELTLPDYCPDIQKILKCQICPSVTSASILGDNGDISGNITVRVLYLDAAGETIRCYENTSRYDLQIPVKTVTGNGIILPRINVEYVNCCATSPRRLDIHGSFSVFARVWERRDLELLTEVEEEDVEQLRQETTFSTCAGTAQQVIALEEVLELGDGKPSAETLLRTDAAVLLQECRMSEGKLMVRGEVQLKVLYATDLREGLPEFMEYALPFQQLIDCGRVEDTAQPEVSVSVMSAVVQVKSDSTGENNLLEAEVKLLATVQCYEDTTVELLTDAYSRTVEVTLDHQQRTFLQFSGDTEEICSEKNTFQFPEGGISKVIDVWNESCTAVVSSENQVLQFKGKYNVCLLALNGAGKPFYFERTVELAHQKEQGMEGPCRCYGSGEVTNLSYRITGSDTIELKTELRLTASLFREVPCRYVSEVIPNPDLPKPQDEDAALVLYYAGAGESLWEIAKQYNTGSQQICAENHLDDDVIDTAMMLMIPI